MPIPNCEDCGQPVTDEIQWGEPYAAKCAFCRQSPIAFEGRTDDPEWFRPYRERLNLDGAA